MVDIRGKDGNVPGAAVLDIAGNLAGIAVHAVEHGGHEGYGVIPLEPPCLGGDHGVGRGVGLVEGVGGKGDHLVVDVVGHVLRHAVAHTAGDGHMAVFIHHAVDEILPLLLHDFVLLLGHGAAHQVAAAVGIAGQVAHNLHHLLLIDHAAVGHVQNRAELFRFIVDAFRVLLALDIPGDGVHGPWTVEGNGGDDVLEAGGFHVGQEGGHAAAFQLEHAHGVAGGNHLIHRRIVHGDVLGLHVHAVPVHHVQGIADHGQRAQAQKVHLQKAQPLDGAHGILGGDDLVVALQGNILHHGLAGNQHARGMGGGVAGHAFQRHGHVDQALHLGLFLIHAVQQGRELQRLLQRHAQVEGHGLGHRVGVLIAHAQHPAHVADDGLGRHGAEGDDLAHMIGAVLAGHIIDDLLTALVAEVHVDVGHGHALRVQEALEQQLILQRVQHGDAQGIRHDGACAAAAPWADHDALLLGVMDEIPHNKEVIHIAHAGNHAQLVVQAGVRLVALLRAGIQAGDTLMAQAGQHAKGRFAIGHGVMGQAGDAEFKLHIAPPGNFLCAVHRVGAGAEKPAHLLLALDVELGSFHAHAVLIIQGFAGLDAHEHFLGLGVLFLQVVAVVGGHQRHVHFPGQLNQPGQHQLLVADAVIHDFDIEIPLAEDILHFPHIGPGIIPALLQKQLGQVAGQAGGQAYQPLVMLADQVVIHPGAVVIARQEALGTQMHQVLIALIVLTQEDQMAVIPASGGFVQAVAADVHLAADDGLDARILHGGIEVDGTVHHAVVGHGAHVHAQLLHPLHQAGDAARAVQQAVFRVQVQMCKAHAILHQKCFRLIIAYFPANENAPARKIHAGEAWWGIIPPGVRCQGSGTHSGYTPCSRPHRFRPIGLSG